MIKILILLAPAASLLATPTLAQTGQSPVNSATATPSAQDPTRMAEAAKTIDYVFPVGTYARMMNGSMDAIMKSAMQGMSAIPLKQLAAIGGVDEAKLAKMGNGSLKEMMAILDPAYEQRVDLSMHAMMDQIVKLMTRFEPEVRNGLTQAYASNFTIGQLQDMNKFFTTPAGTAYASKSMMLFMDPAVTTKMQAFMPEMMKQMPAIGEQVKAATAKLPKPRAYADLTTDEKARLAALLGISEDQLAKQKRQ